MNNFQTQSTETAIEVDLETSIDQQPYSFSGDYFRELATLGEKFQVTDCKGKLLSISAGINLAGALVDRQNKQQNKVIFIGNGGSATGEHNTFTLSINTQYKSMDKLVDNERYKQPKKIMTPDQKRKLKEHSSAIAEILYAEGELGESPTLERIEKTIQAQMKEYVSPEIASFFLENQQEQQREEAEN